MFDYGHGIGERESCLEVQANDMMASEEDRFMIRRLRGTLDILDKKLYRDLGIYQGTEAGWS